MRCLPMLWFAKRFKVSQASHRLQPSALVALRGLQYTKVCCSKRLSDMRGTSEPSSHPLVANFGSASPLVFELQCSGTLDHKEVSSNATNV